MNRRQFDYILNDLQKKMVFLVGPRQVGKTWLSRQIMAHYQSPIYLNYDQIDDQIIIKNQSWPAKTDLLILDELHKLPNWKLFLKGIYDTKETHLHILVTGSARLDTFRQSGDSLAGRFFAHRLMPLSLAELHQLNLNYPIDDLILKGGFPEPFLAKNTIEADRWRNQYIDGLIREDILYFDAIQNLKSMQLLVDLLRRRVGSPISVSSLSRDLNLSHHTVKKYIDILESLFIIFRVTPWSKNIARSILKEPKIYFYDTGLVTAGEGAQFENFVAISLLKHVHGENDYLGKRQHLHYIRTKDGKELDFCITSDTAIETIIEAKLSDHRPTRYAYITQEKENTPLIWLLKNLRLEQDINNISIRKADMFLKELFL